MLNQGQQYMNHVMNLGYNVFVTGEAGTGKSYTLRKFIEDKVNSGFNVQVAAPTGIAADNINGITLHHMLHTSPNDLYYLLIKKEEESSAAIEMLSYTDILIIDEISTCRIDLFDVMSRHILSANKIRKRYGRATIQLIISGDFFQLPPVVTERDRTYLNKHYNREIGCGFAFDSTFWDMFDFKYIMLQEIVRQNNIEFTHLLNRVRIGDKTVIEDICNKCSKIEMERTTTLYGKNIEAYNKNIEELNKLTGDIIEYNANILGDITSNDVIADINLKLKEQCRVIAIINDAKYNMFVNGSLGTVTKLSKDYITVVFDNGNICNIEKHEWKIYNYKIEQEEYTDKANIQRYEIGSIEQFPLKLAYAITIHKSQGQTYDRLNLSPYCWDCGQLYVALSRVKKLDNLHIRYKIHKQDVVISLNVINFHNKIVKEANKPINLPKNEYKENKNSELDLLLNKLSNI